MSDIEGVAWHAARVEQIGTTYKPACSGRRHNFRGASAQAYNDESVITAQQCTICGVTKISYDPIQGGRVRSPRYTVTLVAAHRS